MKTIAKIGTILPEKVGEMVFCQLRTLFPGGVGALGGRGFDMHLPEDDVRVGQCLFILKRAGLKPWISANGRRKEVDEFSLCYERIYEDRDFSACELVEIHPEYLFEDTWPNRLGGGRTSVEGGRLLELGVEYLQGGHDCAFTELGGYAIAVPDRVRRLFEKGGLTGVAYRETVPLVADGSVGRPVSWREAGEPWWELTSAALMPPVSPTMDLRNARHERIRPGDMSYGCLRYDGLYNPVELHYRRKDLRDVSPFDLSHTFEVFGGSTDPLKHALVASKRFYDFCQEHSLKIGWVPVRIED